MASYLLYFPQATSYDAATLLPACGQEGLLRDGYSWEFAGVHNNGPDGGAGVVGRFVDGQHPERSPQLGVFPGQTWHAEQGADKPRFWIGWESRPRACDLLRTRVHPGPGVELAGDNWLLPTPTQLPHTNGMRGGKFTRKLKQEYQEFFEQSEAALRRLVDSWLANDCNSFSWDQAEFWPFTCAALAMNYLLTPEIIDAMGLVDDDAHYTVAAAVTNLEAVCRTLTQKKTECPTGASG